MPSPLPKFTLRIPSELLEEIRIIAQKNGRSVNKEIEMVLKEYAQKQTSNS